MGSEPGFTYAIASNVSRHALFHSGAVPAMHREFPTGMACVDSAAQDNELKLCPRWRHGKPVWTVDADKLVIVLTR